MRGSRRGVLFAAAAALLLLLLVAPGSRAAVDQRRLERSLSQIAAQAAALPRLHALIIEQDGSPLLARAFRGPALDTPVDVKSISKILIDTLIGIAIDRGILAGTSERMLPLLSRRAPRDLDPRVGTITLDDLLSMRAGLARTSGPGNYGAWVSSRNWVQYVLTRPFVDVPSGTMLYSTGNTHLLSAILTDASGHSIWQLARDWLGAPLGIEIPRWIRDPQGIYLGGNEMAISPIALARIGETYRESGVFRGRRIVSAEWVRRSWTPEAMDRWGHRYGYGWFIAEADGIPVYYGWGYGGQMLYVVPSLALTVVITSASDRPSFDGDYICALHELLARWIIPTFAAKPPTSIDDAALCVHPEADAGP